MVKKNYNGIIRIDNNKSMEKKLTELFKRAQTLLASKTIEAKKLIALRAEIKKALDNAIDAMPSGKNLFKELEEKRAQLRLWRIGIWKTIFPINYKYVLTMPFIYGMIFPTVFFHVCLEIYHQVCFRFYGIPLVKSSDYFIYDRRLLPYLNWLEKINCIYCSYGNNLVRYAAEIGGRTERYWCPIKFSKNIDNPHSQYDKFFDYLDARSFREKWEDLRDFSDLEKKSSLPSTGLKISADKKEAEDKEEKPECDFIRKD